ncbi:TetR/AcrR family transcriptional regulator [Micromonospora halotolerans]|jgi:AcrR family transcriptional regulator|uniref:TetR/AcrR family transcriptional regulator n=2 Tax=Micromonospora TaxID=1873 RepID=A0ABZ0A3J9_9ACTN|nr:TetR/AcrR family transcriptional regulator [Micromonospora halotolerans]WNM41933.1 TetR/AcrR family transcriptional regulator [Micromonospora halotolerans]
MPRSGLTRDRVVAQAATVADEVGFDRLALATVAKRLNVSLPALYKHIDSLAGLQRDVAVLGVRELTVAISTATVGRSGRDALHAAARAYREYALAHPGRAAAAVRAPDPADAEHLVVGRAAVEVLLALLRGYDITGDDAIHAVRAMRVVLHGFVTLEAAGGFGLPQSLDETFDRLVDSLDATFRAWAAGVPTKPS